MISVTIIFISSIIIETVLLKIFIKKKWYESFKLCTIANLLSIFAYFLFVYILVLVVKMIMSFSELIVAILYLSSWLALLVIPIWVENAIYQKYWKDIPHKKLLKIVITINIITCLLLGILFYCIPRIYNRDTAKLRCSSNLKQIGLSLRQYAMDYDYYLPDKPGVEGFEQLRTDGYLVAYGIFLNSDDRLTAAYRFYNCPAISMKRVKKNQKLNDEIVDYIYQNGHRIETGADESRIPVAWDKPTNHNGYGNVLFLDGHVKCFGGKDWMEQARIKKTATQQGK